MSIDEKIKDTISRMSLKEKVDFCHGTGLFQTAALNMSDGPMGVRREFENDSWKEIGTSADFVSYLPSNMAVAATWSLDLAAIFGDTLGKEARGRGKDIILAPGINIVRSPLGGRNFEYMSEDPYLISKLVVPLIEGIQKNDVAACVKHFVANNHEHNRLNISVEVDEQALREIYLPGFKAAVTEGKTLTIMSAYNRLRGDFCSENSYLLKDILRDEWKFDGIVISDWGAVHNTVKAVENGLDMEMRVETNFNEFYLADSYLNKLESGELPESELNKKVANILRVKHKLNMFSKTRNQGSFNSFENWDSTLKIARESVVLLKNEDNILPIQKGKKKITVIGENADRIHSPGGGSAEIKALFEVSPLLGLNMISGGDTSIDYYPGYRSDDEINLAVEAAKTNECVIIFCGLNHDHDREEFDRTDFNLPSRQDILITRVLEVNKDAIIVNLSGSPVAMPWIDKANTLIQLFYSGMFSGQVVAEVIFGAVNPSGKLPITFPVKISDSPDHALGEFPGDEKVEYKEGIFVGYRYYDKYKVKPLFPFGHGLSYSSFEYKDLSIVDLDIKVTVKNCGKCPGFETIQLYIGNMATDEVRPVKELKAFHKVFLEAGEEKTHKFKLKHGDFSYYSSKLDKWVTTPGEYSLLCGSSSGDIRLERKISL